MLILFSNCSCYSTYFYLNYWVVYFIASLVYTKISFCHDANIISTAKTIYPKLICNIHQIGEYCNIYIFRSFAIFTNFMNIATQYISRTFAIFTNLVNIATLYISKSFAIFTKLVNIATYISVGHLQYSPNWWILQHYISQLICNIHQFHEYCSTIYL